MIETPQSLAFALLCALFPFWLLAGLTDYWCHRKSSIETTSGFAESRLHVLQAFELAVPLLAGLFLEINALVLTVMILFIIAHSLTSLWDVNYTHTKRYISPLEQHAHSYMDTVPVVAVLIVALLHLDQFQTASFSLQLKADPLPPAVIALVLVTVLGIQGLPLLEECWRTWRHSSGVRSIRPASTEGVRT